MQSSVQTTSTLSSPQASLLGFSKSYSSMAQIVHTVPLAQESVSENGERSDGLREVHSHKGTNAGSLNFQNVVEGGNGEVMSAQGNSKIRKRVTLGTVNRVLAVPRLGSSNLLVPKEK